MTHRLTRLERLRQHITSVLHLPLSAVGLYAERTTPRDQYALTVHMPFEELEAELHYLGFVRNLISSLKRREYQAPPGWSVASWVTYPAGVLFSRYQLHLALYVGPNERTTDVYAHWEPSWIRHPIRHYRAVDVDAAEGVRRTRSLFDGADISFEIKPVEVRFDRRSGV